MTYKAATTEFICRDNKSVYSLINSPVSMALPAFAAERRAAAHLLLSAVLQRPPLSIDTSCAPSTQQQNRRTPQRLSNDGTDRQTDRQTDARARPVVLLDQQCGAVGCNTVINEPSSKRPTSLQSDSQSAYTIINTKNCSLSIVLTATDQKPQKSLKR